MKTTRTFASLCLTASCIALFAATNVSVGDQPGVYRMAAAPQQQTPVVTSVLQPTPDPASNAQDGEDAGQFSMNNGSAQQQNGQVQGAQNPPQFLDPQQVLQRSGGVTSPIIGSQGFATQPLVGPQATFEQVIDSGLGFQDSYTRINARIPNHLIPNTSILSMDLSASLSASGDDLYNYGAVLRHYNEAQNRIWGINFFGDFDNTSILREYSRVGFGVESLGRYVDFILNGYLVTGDDSILSSRVASTGLSLRGNNVVRSFTEVRENAYSGFDAKVGGPLPFLGRRGVNGYVGTYFLDSDFGTEEALGISFEVQLLATESLEVNAYYTNDEVFDTNSWVSIAYTIPHTRQKRILRPKSVRERLTDPVRRTNTIHSELETSTATEAVINPKTAAPWTIVYVDPNATSMGTGTIESPFMTLQTAADTNVASIDAIRVVPRGDDTGTNLTVAGGLDLFPEQALFSSHKDFALFTEAGSDFVIPAIPTLTGLGPLIQDPTIMAGDAVVDVTDWNRINGVRLDAANAAGTVFGHGVAGTDVDGLQLSCNTFTNYVIGANILSAEDELLFDDNTFTGLAGASMIGLNVETRAAGGSVTELRIANNSATNNSTTGINVTANTGSTINAVNPAGVGGATATGVTGNSATGNGQGIVMTAETGATINAVVNGNTATNNTFNGFVGDANGGTFNLASMSGNTFSMNLENGAFLRFRDGGTFTATSEDLNGNGIIDPGEDTNGNGILDQGIVSNVMNDNGIAGLCLFGEDASTGDFDIGGPVATLGNTFSGNTGAGIAVDLQDTSDAGIDALFNTISGGSTGPAGITIVLDFIDPAQGSVVDALGRTVDPFDVTNFGFNATDFDLITNAVLQTVQNTYASIPTAATDPNSPIPDGFALDIDFVIGDTGVAPSNGATEFYVVTIGDSATSLDGLLGQAADIGNIRNAMGQGPGMGLFGTPQANGASSSSVYTSEFAGIGGLNPPTAHGPTELYLERPLTVAEIAGLTSGNLTATRFAIGNVTAHEVGHTLSLRHILNTGAVTPTGIPPVMGTGALDQPNQAFIEQTEFAFSGTNPGEVPGEAPFTQNSIAQLASAVGLRTSGNPQGNGITIVGGDSARLRPSTFLQNTITGNTDRGINIEMNDMAVAEDVTIQGNSIVGNGTGVRLAANGPGASIDASRTIGGAGMNTLGGTMFAQSNTMSNSAGDGFQAQASNGGSVVGNLLNNTIADNGGNGATFTIDGGGFIDFGTGMPVAGSTRIVSGNTITGNTGAGISATSTVDVTVSEADQQMDLLIQGNTISNNTGGGIIAELNGVNNVPPGPPALGFRENNVLNLGIGQTMMPFATPVTTETNTIDGNGGVGIGLMVNGTGLANVSIVGNTITNTAAGTGLFNGDGINLIRRDSSLLLADVLHNTLNNNASNGLEVDTQGTNKDNQNQPMVGTVNSVTWNNNVLNDNGENGASFATRGDSQLFANGMANVLMGNTRSGILVSTSESSSFGDPTLVGDARRTMFNGIIASNNGRDGIELNSIENSQLLVEITSERIATTSGAHAALNTMGDTSISNNGRDGIHIESGGTSTPDILITSETPVTPTSAITLISGNGTGGAGGNGIFWDSYEAAAGSVQVYNTMIIDSIAGASEDANGDGLLTFAEDTLGNFEQNLLTGQNADPTMNTFGLALEGNLDIDVANGDGIQFNYFHATTSALTVGAAGMGNMIQGNQDDGIALTGDQVRAISDTDPFGTTFINALSIRGPVAEPTINISNNLIGGNRNGVPAGNGGDGISIRNFGNTANGVMPGDVDNDIDDGDGLDPGSGPDFPATFIGGGAADLLSSDNITNGPIPDITIANNMIASNSRIGVNIRLNGGAGRDNLRTIPVTLDPAVLGAEDYNRITLTGNTIVSNGEEGVFLRADSDMSQNRIVFTRNLDDGMMMFNVDTNDPTGVDMQSGFDPDDVDSINGLGYLNLRTTQNTLFTVTGNTIQSNGTNTVNGEGLEIRVGTGAFVAADVRDNVFGGNLEEDLFTGSFYSDLDLVALDRANTFTSEDVDGEFLFDIVYLDDAALLDMRFTGNSGDQINPLEDGAFLTAIDLSGGLAGTIAQDIQSINTNADPIKGTLRTAGVFKIDDFFNLSAPTNNFVELGVPQSITGAFATFQLLNPSAESPWPETPFQDIAD